MHIKLNLFILSFIFLFTCACQSNPQIHKDKVFFNEKKILNINPKQIFFENPEEANKLGLPVFKTTEAKIIEKWKKIAVYTQFQYYEERYIELKMYSFSGELLSPSIGMYGELFFLEKVDYFVFLDTRFKSNGYDEKKISFIFNQNNLEVRKILHRSIDSHEFSEDEKLLYIFSNDLDTTKSSFLNGISLPYTPLTRLEVINMSGELVYEKKYYNSEEIEIKYENTKYKIMIPKPDLPG